MSVNQPVFAQATYDSQKAEKAMRSADLTAMIGYIVIAIGLTLIVAAIPIAIYRDRKKRARTATPTAPPPEKSSRPDDDQ
jgi:hypothetical protein